MKIDGISIENIISHGYDFEILDENIILIKNFLTDSECEYIIRFARNSSQEQWEKKYISMLNDFVKINYNIDNVYDSEVPITDHWNDKIIEIEDIFDLEKRLMVIFEKKMNYMCSPFNIIQRQYEGAELPGHYDKFVDKTVVWAAVAYPNDDYFGGEFYFEKRGIEIVPPKKSLLVFPSTEEYWHGVRSVKGGPERYSMPVFIHDSEWAQTGEGAL